MAADPKLAASLPPPDAPAGKASHGVVRARSTASPGNGGRPGFVQRGQPAPLESGPLELGQACEVERLGLGTADTLEGFGQVQPVPAHQGMRQPDAVQCLAVIARGAHREQLHLPALVGGGERRHTAGPPSSSRRSSPSRRSG